MLSGGIYPDCFVIHKRDTMKHYFCESKEGIFYLDLQVDLNTVAFVMTVEDMEPLYSNHDVCNAKAAKKNFNVSLVGPTPGTSNI